MGHVIHLYAYTVEGGLMPWILKDGSSLQLLEPCVHMRLATFNGQCAVVGLSQTAKLYVNTTQLATNCSSFYIHDNFLLLTTHWHTFHCVSLHQDVSELKMLTNEGSGNESIRNVERGSRIVTAISCDTRVVLQVHTEMLVICVCRVVYVFVCVCVHVSVCVCLYLIFLDA